MGREKNKRNKKGCGCRQREREVNRVSSLDQPNMERSRSRSRSRSYVPQDLLEDILVRLPVKPIIRFKCLNKLCYTLFQNPTFIAKHHSFQSQNNPNLVVQGLGYQKFSQFFTLLHLIHSDNDPGVSLDMHNVSLDIRKYYFTYRRLLEYICDCINGIFCIGNETNGFVLWNPAMREYKVVPKPPHRRRRYPSEGNTTCVFGYDHNSNDFKLVRIENKKTRTEYNRIHLNEILHPIVHVYNLSTNSWRLIHTATFFDRLITRLDFFVLDFFGDFNEIYFNGVYHCFGIFKNKRGRHGRVIVSFNMRDEMFRIIRMPYLYIKNSAKKKGGLSVLRNCLALIIYDMHSSLTEEIIDIWMMNEYGVGESWTKQFVIGPHSPVELPLNVPWLDCLLRLGRQHCWGKRIKNEGPILFYDFGTQKMKKLQFTNHHDLLHVLGAIVYVESLVSVKGGIKCL